MSLGFIEMRTSTSFSHITVFRIYMDMLDVYMVAALVNRLEFWFGCFIKLIGHFEFVWSLFWILFPYNFHSILGCSSTVDSLDAWIEDTPPVCSRANQVNLAAYNVLWPNLAEIKIHCSDYSKLWNPKNKQRRVFWHPIFYHQVGTWKSERRGRSDGTAPTCDLGVVPESDLQIWCGRLWVHVEFWELVDFY